MAYIDKAKTDEWETPQELFDSLNDEFHFTIDVCATKENAKVKRFYTKDQDGLKQNWEGETVWCNPPYGRAMYAWIHKCYKHSIVGGGTAVMLIPSRTDTKAFHDWILPYAELRFVRGRLKFGGSKTNAPFPSVIVVFRPEAIKDDKRP